MNVLIRKTFLYSLALISILIGGTHYVNADDTLNIDGYVVTTQTGFISESNSIFISQPWWGNAGLASTIATGARNTLDDWDPDPLSASSYGPIVVYGDTGPTNNSTVQVLQFNGTIAEDYIYASSSLRVFLIAIAEPEIIVPEVDNRDKSSIQYRPVAQTVNPDLFQSNIPICESNVWLSGMSVVGNGEVTHYVDYKHKDECFKYEVEVLPEDVDSRSEAQVFEHLGSSEFDVYKYRPS
ncbi:hypothetical protein N9P76_04585 [Amylibacter sp.]|nr:hypothetical protein [Amylibacter sp.]